MLWVLNHRTREFTLETVIKEKLMVSLTLCAIRLSLLLTLLLLELHVTMMKNSSSEFVDAHFLFSTEAQDVNSSL